MQAAVVLVAALAAVAASSVHKHKRDDVSVLVIVALRSPSLFLRGWYCPFHSLQHQPSDCFWQHCVDTFGCCRIRYVGRFSLVRGRLLLPNHFFHRYLHCGSVLSSGLYRSAAVPARLLLSDGRVAEYPSGGSHFAIGGQLQLHVGHCLQHCI